MELIRLVISRSRALKGNMYKRRILNMVLLFLTTAEWMRAINSSCHFIPYACSNLGLIAPRQCLRFRDKCREENFNPGLNSTIFSMNKLTNRITAAGKAACVCSSLHHYASPLQRSICYYRTSAGPEHLLCSWKLRINCEFLKTGGQRDIFLQLAVSSCPYHKGVDALEYSGGKLENVRVVEDDDKIYPHFICVLCMHNLEL